MEERIKKEGTQLIDLTPVDTALEAIACLSPAGAAIIRSWSDVDTAVCISTIVGYVVTLTLAFLLHKRVNGVQQISLSTNARQASCAFSDVINPKNQEPEPENLTNLIEIMPIPPRRTPNN